MFDSSSSAPHSSDREPITPEPIIRVASGFMAAKHLFVANEIGLFDALNDGPATLDSLIERVRIPARSLRIVADAVVALGIIEKTGNIYRHSAVSQAFLSNNGVGDLRPFLTFWNRLSYPNWLDFESVVRGQHQNRIQSTWTQQEMEVFSKGVEAVTAGTAQALAQTYDFASTQRLLDVGGGTGSFLIVLLQRFPQLEATLFELPPVIEIARKRLHSFPYHDRIRLVAGDFLSDSLPEGHDTVLIANVVHLLSPEHSISLLKRVRQAATVGTRLLLVDFWTDPSHTQPTFAALMAGEFLMVTGEGDVYSVEEATHWLQRTGWNVLTHQPLAGPASLIVAEARE